MKGRVEIDPNILAIKEMRTRRSRIRIRETVKIAGFHMCLVNQYIRFIIIPPSVEIIDNYAFFRCSSLISIKFKRISRLKFIGNYSFQETPLTHFEFPSSVEVIGAGAFRFCSNLSSISFPNDSKLISIRTCAFRETSLESIQFPSSLEVIESYAFYKIDKLSSILFPENSLIRIIEEYAFYLTHARENKFKHVVEVGVNAFPS